MTTIKIAPSLLSADFSRLADEIRSVEQAGADWLHCDVMDGHFVPNITIGPFVIEAIKKAASKPLDVHIMISDPLKYAPEFCKAGADILTFHLEAAAEPLRVIDAIRNAGVKVGVAISPDTPAQRLDPVLSLVDMALVMTVHPGFGGQKFMGQCLEKVRYVRQKTLGRIDIEVDGGLGASTVAEAAEAGANAIVAGTAVFKAADRAAAIAQMRALVRENLPLAGA